MTPKPPPKCPACGSSRVVPILHGYPTEEAELAAQRGEIVLGGCMVMGDGSDPEWACKGCGKEFGEVVRFPIRVSVDTCVINAKGALPAMNRIEAWAGSGKVLLCATERLVQETANHRDRRAKAASMKRIGEPFVLDESLMDGDAYLGEEAEPSFDQIAAVLFPGRSIESLPKSDCNDVMHLMAHEAAGCEVFLTNNTHHFILRGRRENLLAHFGIVVMTPDEFVEKYGPLLDDE